MTERAFFIELREIITGKNLKKAVCTQSIGNPPAQTVDFEEMEKTVKNNDLGIDEDFYGNDDFDPSELDTEGFDRSRHERRRHEILSKLNKTHFYSSGRKS